ncbi:unnamed protein product [Urochloa decumbens]|uniref:F-box associated beta-propeller type 3 domain-containing protein n=1 Tax=Urochloa decumbens TaxID=240449 RepID=A0ABC9E1B2_9POAL
MEGAAVSLPEDIIFDVLSRLPVKPPVPVPVRVQGVARPHLRSRCKDEHKLELRVMDMDGSVLRVFKDVVTTLLLPTRLDLVCVYGIRGGATIIDPASGRVSTVGKHNPNTPIRYWDYSFGRETPSGAYKLLRIQETFNDDHGQLCEIATIGDSGAEPTWRQRPAPPFVTDWYEGRKATVIGTLYFMPHTSSGRRESGNSWNRIAAFDLKSEEWTDTINGPPMGRCKEGESWTIALAEFKATLNMVQMVRTPAYEDGHGLCTNIWALIDSKKSIWIKQYTIEIPRNLFLHRVLDVLSDGRILLLNSFWKQEKNVFSHRSALRYIIQFYNPSTKAVTDIMEMAEEFGVTMSFYTGSLLS